jgi:hypothetical protein
VREEDAGAVIIFRVDLYPASVANFRGLRAFWRPFWAAVACRRFSARTAHSATRFLFFASWRAVAISALLRRARLIFGPPVIAMSGPQPQVAGRPTSMPLSSASQPRRLGSAHADPCSPARRQSAAPFTGSSQAE